MRRGGKVTAVVRRLVVGGRPVVSGGLAAPRLYGGPVSRCWQRYGTTGIADVRRFEG